jgi:cytochrome d ubiquinol oxidase subunit II
MLELILAGTILISITFYVLMGGADFGAGVWSFLAYGPRARAQRRVIEAAISPIWEANHVWLILAVTVLFTAFPAAFALISITLHIPLTLMLIGIVLRGSAFAFRMNDVERDPAHAVWGWMFAGSSLLTPVLLGVIVGAIASGSLDSHAAGFLDRFIRPWWALFPLSVGFFALALFAFLAAVYLTVETTDRGLQDDFRRRAFAGITATAVMAVIVLLLSKTGAPAIHALLTRRGGILWILLTAVLAISAFAALWKNQFRLARMLAIGQAATILWGWALTQFPYLVEPHLTIYNAAAPTSTLRLLLIALVPGAILLFPSLYYLFRIFKGARKGEDPTPASRGIVGQGKIKHD